MVKVKKPNGKWRMCVDFMDLNKACPKDSYPLPQIDTLVDSSARHELLSFMDAFLGYNHIKMKEEDQEKTSFVTSQALFVQGDAVRTQERRGNVLEINEQNVRALNRKEHRSLR